MAGTQEGEKDEGRMSQKTAPAPVTLLSQPILLLLLPRSWINQACLLLTVSFSCFIAKIARCHISKWQCFLFTGHVL